MPERRIWTKDDVKEIIVGHETYKKLEDKGEMIFEVCHVLGVSIMISSDLNYGDVVTTNMHGDVLQQYHIDIRN